MIQSGNEYCILMMLLDVSNRRRIEELKSGGYLIETKVDGERFPRYSVTKSGMTYMETADGY